MRPTGPVATLVTVGEELLSGATLDRNSAWLGGQLSALGIPVIRGTTVGDRDADIAEAVTSSVSRADLVVVTGGLGPTEDDRTRPVVADALGVPLIEDPGLLEALQRRYRAAGRDQLPLEMRALALRPDPGLGLLNPLGAAPGLAFPRGAEGTSASVATAVGWVVLLPGVPREMRGLFPQVERLVLDTFAGRLRPMATRLIHTTGLPESQLAPRVEEALGTDRTGVEVAYLPDLEGVDVRLTVRAAADPEGEAGVDRLQTILAWAEARIAPVLDGLRFEAASGDLAEALQKGLQRRGWTFATAESCTGGLVAERYTRLAGASHTFVGAVVAYANAVKVESLGVDPEGLAAHGAVSEAVAVQMARGACERLGADCAVSLTGVAGPGGGSPGKPVGTVWIGLCTPDAEGRRVARAIRYSFAGDREAVRARAAQAALHLLHRRLEDE